MYTFDNVPTNTIIAGLASTPTWVATVVDPSNTQLVLSVVMPIVILLLGKLLDLSIRVLLEKRGERKRRYPKDNGNNTSS
jgi:hypothetical protein